MLKRTILSNIEQLGYVSELVNIDLLKKTEETISVVIEKKQIEMPKSYLQSIVVLILLIIEQSEAGYEIVFNQQQKGLKFFSGRSSVFNVSEYCQRA